MEPPQLGDVPHAAVLVGALPDVDPEVLLPGADRLLLLPAVVAGVVGEGAVRAEVALGRELAERDADVLADAGLGGGAVVVAGGVDGHAGARVVGRGVAVPGRRLGPEAAAQQAGAGVGAGGRVVVGGEVHRVRQGVGRLGVGGDGVADHHERGGQPAVVHAGGEGVDGVARVGEAAGELEGGGVVPVVVLAGGRVALHAGQGVQHPADPGRGVAGGDQAQVAGDEGAPHVRGDVGGRGDPGPRLEVAGHLVGGQAGGGFDHGGHRPPRVPGVAVQGVVGGLGGDGGRREGQHE